MSDLEKGLRVAVEENGRLTDALFQVWDLIGDVANECEPCQLPEEEGGERLVPSNELLREWQDRLHRACNLIRETLFAPIEESEVTPAADVSPREAK